LARGKLSTSGDLGKALEEAVRKTVEGAVRQAEKDPDREEQSSFPGTPLSLFSKLVSPMGSLFSPLGKPVSPSGLFSPLGTPVSPTGLRVSFITGKPIKPLVERGSLFGSR
jgi:hypothetical protein